MTALAVGALPAGSSAGSNHAASCTRYAAPLGSDVNPGSRLRPFKTAQRLVDSLSPGATGCLRAGTYSASTGDVVVRFAHSGSPRARITVRSFPGERAKLRGIVIVPNGSDDVTLDSLAIEGTGGQITVNIYAADVIVENSNITNAWRGDSCMILGSNSGYGQAVRTIVRDSRFHECGSIAHGNHDHAIYANNLVDGRIVRNLFWDSAAYAIHLYPNAQRTLVARNIIDGGAPSLRGGILFGGDSGYPASSGNIVEYNIIAYAQTYNVDSWWGAGAGRGNIARYNCLWGARQGNINTEGGGFTTDANTVADPRFVSRKKHDYRLKPSSRCRPTSRFDAAAHAKRP
jgi:hypothetical protein